MPPPFGIIHIKSSIRKRDDAFTWFPPKDLECTKGSQSKALNIGCFGVTWPVEV